MNMARLTRCVSIAAGDKHNKLNLFKIIVLLRPGRHANKDLGLSIVYQNKYNYR
jgi:hypothetical protein